MKNLLVTLALYLQLAMFPMTVVQAEGVTLKDYSQLSVSEAQLEQCSKRDQIAYKNVRDAIANKQYELALELLGKPVKDRPRTTNPKETHPGEVNYLYGKTQFLMAYQKVNEHTADAPDQNLLAQAKKYLDKAAQQGLPEAIYDKAMLLTAPADNAEKLRLLKVAADKKYAPAMLTLAEHRFYAIKTFEQRTEAQALIKEAAAIDSNANVTLVSYYLHEDQQLVSLAGYDKDIDKAINILYTAATECSAQAAYKLFLMSKTEHKPNDLPVERSIYWLEVSARLGYAKAQGDIADYYQSETQDSEKATYWAIQASERGDLKGLLTLAKIYYQGTGSEKDFSKALQYYEQALAIDKDNRLALNQLGIMYYRGEGSEADFRKAASFCERAADKGQAGCQYYLGLMYVNGEGVTQDIDTGISWMKKSAAQDFPVAKNWLRENW